MSVKKGKSVLTKEKLSPKEFSNALNDIEIRKIGFLEIQSKLYPENFREGEITVNADNRADFQMDQINKTFIVIDHFDFTGMIKNSKVFTIQFKIMVIFGMEKEPTKDFLTLFEKNTLKVITYPYAREIVQDLTTKMGLPPFVLPMWRVPAAAKKEFLRTSSGDEQ